MKRTMKRKMKKGLILALAMVTVLCLGIGGTLAYLFVSTAPVTNTFSYGDVNITLWENNYILDGNKLGTEVVYEEDSYKMIPGNTMPKNPTVTVEEGSEACYLFVKIAESANFDTFMTYGIADGWTALGGEDGVYYREVAATDADTNIQVLAGIGDYTTGAVTVNADVEKDQLNALTPETLPTLTFTAYAVQKANVADAAAAWGIANPTNP